MVGVVTAERFGFTGFVVMKIAVFATLPKGHQVDAETAAVADGI